MPPSQPNQTHPPPQKVTLYCFNCGHASGLGGDWTVHNLGDRVRSDCPECGTTIDSRPKHALVLVG